MIPDTMQAIVQEAYGSADELELREVACPRPARGQLLVRVHATNVTQADCSFRSGTPWIARIWSGLRRPTHRIPGMGVAGEVVAVGPGVTHVQPGDRVAGISMAAGAYAELALLRPTDPVSPIPDDLDYEQALSALGAHTALWFLRDAADLQPGQRLLINGASGEVGSTAVQIGKHLGAHVTGVTSTRNLELVRSLGADAVIDYTTEDFTRRGETYDVVLDAVGKSSFRACRAILAPRGLYLSTVPTLSTLLHAIRPWGSRRASFQTAGLNHTADHQATLFELARTGALTPHVDRRGTLADLPDAHRYVESERKRGQVLIFPTSPARGATYSERSPSLDG